jgi:hypothetical protein
MTSHSLSLLHCTLWHAKLYFMYQHFKKIFETEVQRMGTKSFCHYSYIKGVMLIMSCHYFRSQRQKLTMNLLMFTIPTFHGRVLGEKY